MRFINGLTEEEWFQYFPLLREIVQTTETTWENPKLQPFNEAIADLAIQTEEMLEAEERWKRFGPFLQAAFPETSATKGMIESPLIEIPEMKKQLEKSYKKEIDGSLLLKCDNELPIAGSIKARGGIYEVLKHAESLAIENDLLHIEDDYMKLHSNEFRAFYSKYAISVGSTGNLGLSIGIISAKLGFRVTVHMSSDAKQWKKDLLRSKGVQVIEYETDYSKAVEEGRKQCQQDKYCHFIDDENSKDLFLGYSVAAYRLKQQLTEMNITVDADHPLNVYLPCGVGGGPGGVTYGLKHVFGDHVRCFFAEPTHSPCMLIGMMTGRHEALSVQDFGLDNRTDADGLAVGRPSSFVGKAMEPLLSGIYTVQDEELYKMLAMLYDSEQISLEPSALAGMYGPLKMKNLKAGTHLVWATGGSLVPEAIRQQDYKRGFEYLK
ncbi:D-serine ammonia-lyase [Bacillus tianshenii]|nr:D-serine ammonia-lyase [Bacillus tianshenii]